MKAVFNDKPWAATKADAAEDRTAPADGKQGRVFASALRHAEERKESAAAKAPNEKAARKALRDAPSSKREAPKPPRRTAESARTARCVPDDDNEAPTKSAQRSTKSVTRSQAEADTPHTASRPSAPRVQAKDAADLTLEEPVAMAPDTASATPVKQADSPCAPAPGPVLELTLCVEPEVVQLRPAQVADATEKARPKGSVVPEDEGDTDTPATAAAVDPGYAAAGAALLAPLPVTPCAPAAAEPAPQKASQLKVEPEASPNEDPLDMLPIPVRIENLCSDEADVPAALPPVHAADLAPRSEQDTRALPFAELVRRTTPSTPARVAQAEISPPPRAAEAPTAGLPTAVADAPSPAAVEKMAPAASQPMAESATSVLPVQTAPLPAQPQQPSSSAEARPPSTSAPAGLPALRTAVRVQAGPGAPTALTPDVAPAAREADSNAAVAYRAAPDVGIPAEQRVAAPPAAAASAPAKGTAEASARPENPSPTAPSPRGAEVAAMPVQTPLAAPTPLDATTLATGPALAPAMTAPGPTASAPQAVPAAVTAPAPPTRDTPRLARGELSLGKGAGFGLRSVDAAMASAVEAARALRNGEGHGAGVRMQLAAAPDTARSELERAAAAELAQAESARALPETDERVREDEGAGISPQALADSAAQLGASAGGQAGADQQHDAPPDAPEASQLPLPSQVQDAADAIWLRGNAPRAASVSMDHPELGPVNLVVQQQGERVDVRAMLETPRAANILRAQESALKYGLQQAGMTLGSLRVRTR
ncbi:MAG: hypothetical protein RL385_5252, partial [Pseudomonadota bacterium]